MVWIRRLRFAILARQLSHRLAYYSTAPYLPFLNYFFSLHITNNFLDQGPTFSERENRLGALRHPLQARPA
jgi:hypothetical protein